jgi:hypothetical protein
VTIVAEQYRHVIGVDTHARSHTYAVLDAGTGRSAESATFPTTAAGQPSPPLRARLQPPERTGSARL